jgi:hypothetical protein
MAPLGMASALQQLPQLKALLRLSLGGLSAGRPSASDKWRVWEPVDRSGWEEHAGPVAALLSGLRALNAGLDRAAGRPVAAQPLGGWVIVHVFEPDDDGPNTELAQFRALGEELAHWGGVRVEVGSLTAQEPYAEAVGALLRGAAGVVAELRLEASGDEGHGDPVLTALLRWGRWGRCGQMLWKGTHREDRTRPSCAFSLPAPSSPNYTISF